MKSEIIHSPPGAPGGEASADAVVTELFLAHRLALVRLAFLLVGDQESAEDVVQDAFAAVYRRWSRLADRGQVLPYLRAAVVNGCRTVLRFYLDLSEAEIAQVMGVSRGTVKSTASRALKALAATLQEER
ncbi:hypothetical protein MF672_007850 [Actinomadura sp. ATCC 31491]|uniref:RNA polymerase sigma factor 70 region 4 type 2 domain-containing protein n=1 Tax=Actinomadura luzonensis TaxID=2805427 RepID=A0ABT0FMX0_9ACTN|nr:sigma factor-like helix-turn-helix DNA-binding protein [Actinomadura luzonensis]MCK2213698.1 hypothetical protein [Actinomadura luzonensis]